MNEELSPQQLIIEAMMRRQKPGGGQGAGTTMPVMDNVSGATAPQAEMSDMNKMQQKTADPVALGSGEQSGKFRQVIKLMASLM